MPKISTYSDIGVPAAGDKIPIIDIDAGPETKTVTITNLGAGIAALTSTTPTQCTASAGTVGSSSEVARADHTHQIASGPPGPDAPQAAAGSATDVALSDHAHPTVTPVKEANSTRTLVAGDHMKMILGDHASGLTVTVPDGLAVGFRVELVQRDASNPVTLTNGGGSVVFLVPPGASATPTTGGQHARMVMTIVETDTALVHGVLA